jgi:hypothetical protein
MSISIFFIGIVLFILLFFAFKRSGRLKSTTPPQAAVYKVGVQPIHSPQAAGNNTPSDSKATAYSGNHGATKKPNDVIQFYVDQPDPEEIKKCKNDDPVKFWMPEKDSDRILIYRSGTFLGDGKIGYIPSEHFAKIGYSLSNNLDYTTKIIEKSKTNLRIEYRKTPIEELIQREEEIQSNLEHELRKKYSPRRPIEVLIHVSGGIRVPTGEKLNIVFQDLDFYVEQVSPTIEFQNSANKVIGSLEGTREVIRILKAHFNGYQFHIEVLNVPSTLRDPIRILIKPYKTQK